MAWHREFSGRLRWMCVAAFLVCGAVPAYAQTVMDPQRAEFTPSTDHSTVVDGVAVVTGYRLDIYVSGSSTTVDRVDLGKPTPQSDGQIRVSFLSLLSAPLTAGMTYEARIVAYGPGGEAASGLTNTFSFSVPCAPSLSAGSTSIGAAGGSRSVNVTDGSTCAWTAVSNNTWIHVTSGSSGSGNGTVGFSIDANTSTSSRTGSLTIAGLTFSVQQSGATPCSYTISPTSISPGSSGASGNVGVTAGSTCDWTAVSDRSWLRVTSGASGTGNGTVGYSVDANTSTSARSGAITIGGQTFNVSQSGAPCSYTISPTSISPGASGASGNVGVTAGSTCDWTAVSNRSWIRVTSGASGTGNGTVGYTVDANTSTSARSGVISIGGQTFSVAQAGATPCSYTVSPTSISPAASGASGSVSVTSGSTCDWTAVSDSAWIRVTSGASGTGNGTVGYSVDANTSSSSRTGAIAIGGRTFSVSQAGATPPCSYSISPASIAPGASGASGNVSVAAGSTCDWTAVSNRSWIRVTSGASDTGNGTVGYTVDANTSTSARSGAITIGDKTFSVSQAGVTPCSYSLSPSSIAPAASGASGTVNVTAGSTCGWSAASNNTWIRVTSGSSGTGNGAVGYSVDANTSTSARSGSITIGGQTFSVSQSGASQSCSYSISPSSIFAPATGASDDVAVTTSASCAWTASSSRSWIRVTSGASGTGNGTVRFTVDANSTTSLRAGAITIGGKTYSVTQAAGPACSYTISPTSITAAATGTTGSVTVTVTGTSCGWTAVSSRSWIQVTSGASGTTSGTVRFSVDANTSTTSRTGAITIGGQIFNVSQPGMSNQPPVPPSNLRIVKGG